MSEIHFILLVSKCSNFVGGDRGLGNKTHSNHKNNCIEGNIRVLENVHNSVFFLFVWMASLRKSIYHYLPLFTTMNHYEPPIKLVVSVQNFRKTVRSLNYLVPMKPEEAGCKALREKPS